MAQALIYGAGVQTLIFPRLCPSSQRPETWSFGQHKVAVAFYSAFRLRLQEMASVYRHGKRIRSMQAPKELTLFGLTTGPTGINRTDRKSVV